MFDDGAQCSCEKYTYIRDIELLVLSLQYKIALTVFLQKSTKRLKLIVNFFENSEISNIFSKLGLQPTQGNPNTGVSCYVRTSLYLLGFIIS